LLWWCILPLAALFFGPTLVFNLFLLSHGFLGKSDFVFTYDWASASLFSHSISIKNLHIIDFGEESIFAPVTIKQLHLKRAAPLNIYKFVTNGGQINSPHPFKLAQTIIIEGLTSHNLTIAHAKAENLALAPTSAYTQTALSPVIFDHLSVSQLFLQNPEISLTVNGFEITALTLAKAQNINLWGLNMVITEGLGGQIPNEISLDNLMAEGLDFNVLAQALNHKDPLMMLRIANTLKLTGATYHHQGRPTLEVEFITFGHAPSDLPGPQVTKYKRAANINLNLASLFAANQLLGPNSQDLVLALTGDKLNLKLNIEIERNFTGEVLLGTIAISSQGLGGVE
ncbi:MAG: hypothetical protein ACRCTY_08720, partial [Candidatus Adiutrix sp.]